MMVATALPCEGVKAAIMGCRGFLRRLEYFGWDIHSNFVVDMCFLL